MLDIIKGYWDRIPDASAIGGSVSNGRLVAELRSSEGFQEFGSRVTTAIQVIEALQDDNINLLGVYGKPGVGKSTLILAILDHLENQKIFDEVVVVKFAECPGIRLIQDEIAKQLDLKMQRNDKPAARKGRLAARLKQGRKTLIFLDNVGEKVELSELGIQRESKYCKVIFTTGDRNVCTCMETQELIDVNILSPEESLQLFRQKAGDMVDTYEFGVVAREIVSQCQGLPLAIVTLGRAMQGKKLAIWNYASRELRNSILKNIEVERTCIKISYEFIQSIELELCFLVCCLFPAGYLISIDQLLQYLIGKGLFSDKDTLEEQRGIMHSIVDKLKYSCLLLNTESGCVRMHDVVRDVAISIASDLRECQRFSSITAGGTCMNWSLPSQTSTTHLHTKSSHGQEHLIEVSSAERSVPNPVSVSSGDMTIVQGRISDQGPPLQAKVNVTEGSVADGEHVEYVVSVLSENVNVTGGEVLDGFGGEILDGIGGEALDGRPVEILVSDVSENLDVTGGRVPDRRHAQSPLVLSGDFKSSGGIEGSPSVGETFKCTVAQVKREIWYLFNFRTTVRTLESKVELLVAKRNDVMRSLGKALVHDEALEEAANKWLRAVDDVLTTTTNLNGKAARIKGLVFCSCCTSGRRYQMIIDIIQGLMDDGQAIADRVSDETPAQNLPSALSEDVRSIEDSVSSEITSAIGSRNISAGGEIETFDSRVTAEEWPPSLKVPRSSEYKGARLIPYNMLLRMQNLETLEVANRPELEKLIDFGGEDKEQEEELSVGTSQSAVRMSKISTSTMSPVFSNLRYLKVSACGKLKYLFPMRVVRNMVQLKELRVTECSVMEIIIEHEIAEDDGGPDNDKPILQKMENLELIMLPNLTSFVREDVQFDWPSLSRLHIENCAGLKKLPLGSGSVPNLHSFKLAPSSLFGNLEWGHGDIKSRLQDLLATL